MKDSKRHSLVLTILYFSFFIILVFSGIAVKRLAGHREFVILFHIPAAVFLILAGLEVRKRNQKTYEAEIHLVRKSLEKS
jgi:hypothetical protein